MGPREAAADGVSAILVPVNDTHALTAALERLIADEPYRNKLAQQGRRRVEELFDQRKFWPELERIYRELLKARNLPLPRTEKQPENDPE